MEHCPKQCRICLNCSVDSVNMFQNKIQNSESLVGDFLKLLTNLEIVENDELGDSICLECVKKLQSVFEFIQQCISSDIKLKEFKQNELNKSNETDVIKDSINENDDESSIDLEENCVEVSEKRIQDQQSYSFKCHECPKSFLKKLHLNVHLRSHVKDSEKKYICKVCNKHFIYEYLLKQHEYKHTDKRPFPCKFCTKGCLTAESLKRHSRIHDKNYEKKKHVCKVCMKEFEYPSFLAEHMKNHTGERPYLCSICGKGFRQTGALHYHQKIHSGYKPFQCKICHQRFIAQSVLNSHMRKHTDERPFVCHICGMAFRQSTILKVHQRTHTGDKPILCTVCGKRMSTTGQLTIHLRTHTGEKPYSCSWCSKSFTTKTVLVKHEKIHTGERSYVCDICGKCFRQSNCLKSHQNIHLAKKKKEKNSKETTSAMELAYNHENAIIYKGDFMNLTNSIISEEFVSETVQDIEVKTTDGSIKTHITVLLPAPIPFLQNLDI